jgi:hypothetical protein
MSTQNIIEGILSPKVVSDGTSGYQVKTDIVNVDNITISGSYSGSFSQSQCGTITVTTNGGIGNSTVIIQGLTLNSIVMLTPINSLIGNYYVTNDNNSFSVTMNRNFSVNDGSTTFNYFVARF